jgi:hypothetical protein
LDSLAIYYILNYNGNGLSRFKVGSPGDEVSRFTLARVISVVMHPLLLPVAVLLAVAYAESGGLRAFGGWALIILFFFAALPLVYVYLRSPGGAKRIGDPAAFFRAHPKEICLLAVVCALPCILLMVLFDAPSSLLATIVALLAASLALALVNILYRASYHLAALTTLVIAVVLVWGRVALPAIAVIPIVGWALYALRRHNLAQLAAGFGLALIISIASFYFFDLL